MKKLIPFLLVCSLVACTPATPTPSPTPSAANMDSEELMVYSALLQALYPDESVVLMDQTATGPGGISDLSSVVDSISKQIKGVDPVTMQRFTARNDKPYPLSTHMNIGIPIQFISQEDLRQIFNINQDGWQMFYERYPGTPGITTLSRVGFNDTMDQALLYLGTQSNWLAGAGYYILMLKTDGVWKIDQQVTAWIS